MTGGEMLWTPPADVLERSRIGSYLRWLEARRGTRFDSYQQLWQWSVDDLAGFWSSIWDFFEVMAATPYREVLAGHTMPGAAWFPGATLNYAEHALRPGPPGPAIFAHSQTRPPATLSRDELHDQVARARRGLQRLGVGRGDRVAAYLPNIPETLVAFLATASLGAIWSSCAPEFGTRSVVDRFSQIEPKVLLGVDGYRYGAHRVDRMAELGTLRDQLPSLAATVVVPYLAAEARRLPGARSWAWEELLAEPADLAFDPVPFDHPLYVLYSSGTTGLPKPIVHGHEGAGTARRHRAGRPFLLVHHHRLDDVELPRLRPPRRRRHRAVRRQSRLPRPVDPVAAGRHGRDQLSRGERALPHGVPQGRSQAVAGFRPEPAARHRLDRVAAAGRRLPVGLPGGRLRHAAGIGEWGHRRLQCLRRWLPAGARLCR